jgi:hypothetical protein
MLRFSMCFVACVALLGGLTFLALQLDVGQVVDGCDSVNFPRHLLTLNHECDRTEHLDAKDQAILRSMEAKEQIARDVLAGRLSLRAAAAQFRVVAQTVTYDWDLYRFSQPTWSEERRCCQYVIDSVVELLFLENQEPTEAVRKLTKEAEECS